MPRGISVKVEGMNKAIAKADNLAGLFAKSSAARKAVTASAGELKAKVKAAAPKGPTGNLKKAVKRSAKPFFIKTKANPLQQFVYVDRRIAPHLHLVEFGHGGQKPAPPHPFFRPSVESSRASTRAQIQAGLKVALVI